MSGARDSLGHPAFAGNPLFNSRRSTYERRAVLPSSRIIHDVRPAPSKQTKTKSPRGPVFARTQSKPAPPRLQRSSVLARQFVSAKKHRRRGPRSLNFSGLALASLAVALFVFGVGVGVLQLYTNKDVQAQVQKLATHTEQLAEGAGGDGTLPDGGVVSEPAPDDGVSPELRPSGGYWNPAADEPKYISIPLLNVSARVLKMGVKPNGEIKTPASIVDAGWLETSAKPGESGAMLIDGHVHGPTQPGVFYGIKKLKPGDKIQIERGDGQVLTYSVVKTERFQKDTIDMAAALRSAVPGRPGLNLITCDGRYNVENGYDHRIVVFAVQD